MFVSSTTATKPVAPSWKQFTPHGYQTRAKQHLLNTASAALFLDPGLGKTVIVLTAFDELLRAGVARKMLVVAPLRVCHLTWRQEAAKWDHLRHLRFSLLCGTAKQRRKALNTEADVYIINPENAPWLVQELGQDAFGRSTTCPFDTVCVDEIPRFKKSTGTRWKALYDLIKGCPRRWGLTGTPAPNGYLDLFGQLKMLDDGAALGRYVSHYRSKYFQQDHSGFGWKLRPGAEDDIEERLKPIAIRMGAEDYLELPPLVDDIRYIDMPPKVRKLYEDMRKELLAELNDGTTLTAANTAAAYSKMAQMANGAVYKGDDGMASGYTHLHDTKIEALQELIDELAGQPLLVAYEFNHDLARLQQSLGGEVPYLGAGVSARQAEQIVEAWNAGSLPILLAHPASAGHGLNLQGGGAAHICWFSTTWDLELYDQFIRRIFRQGTTAPRIVNHLLIMRDSIDEMKLFALRHKATTQDLLLRALNAEVIRDDTIEETSTMSFDKLKRLAGGGQPETNNEAPAAQPPGWGGTAAPAASPTQQAPEATPAGWGTPQPTQAAAPEAKKAPATPADGADKKPTRTRKTKASAAETNNRVEAARLAVGLVGRGIQVEQIGDVAEAILEFLEG